MADGISLVQTQPVTLVVGAAEVDLAVDNGSGVWCGEVDLGNLAAGDTVQLALYVRLAAGGSWLQVARLSATGAQDNSTDALSRLKDFGGRAYVGLYGGKITAKQTAGTGRQVTAWLIKLSA